jgi:hypothetical protein
MLTFPISLLLFLAAEPPHNALTPAETSNGWILLFDGKSTNGWLEVTGKPFPVQSWRIEDGCLRAFDPGDGYQDLRTVLEFEPAFEFQFEWKIGPKGNSGIKYFVQRVDDWTNAKGRQARARGLEYQLFDDSVENDRRKITGSLYEALAPEAAGLTKPVGEFNQSMIRVQGSRVEHWLNGSKVVSFDVASPEVQTRTTKEFKGTFRGAARTFLALQNHGTPVWFRDLKVRKIENGTGVSTSPVH